MLHSLSSGPSPLQLFLLLISSAFFHYNKTQTMSITAFLSSPSLSSELLNLWMVLGTPEIAGGEGRRDGGRICNALEILQ